MSAGGSEEAALQRFQEIIAERSDGRLGVDIYLGGQLGNETDVLQLLSLGQTQMALTGGAFMGEYAADYDAVSVPFVFPSWDAVEHYIMETESGEGASGGSTGARQPRLSRAPDARLPPHDLGQADQFAR